MAIGPVKQRLQAINDALGFRRYLFAPLIGAVIGFVDWVVAKLEGLGVSGLLGIPSWVIGVFVGAAIVIFWLVEYIVKLRRRLVPVLRVEYNNAEEDCLKTIQYGEGGNARLGKSIRLRVKCDSDDNVEEAQGYLTRIEYRSHGGQFSSEAFHEPARLNWALEDHFGSVTVFPGVPRYLGVCRTDEALSGFYSRTHHRSYVTPPIFERIGEYRLTVKIVAARCQPKSLTALITWNGKWNEIKACLVENT
jgi:hypothetical protein